MAAISIIAALTDTGRSRIADMTVSGRGFQVQQFVVGAGGHDPLDPTVVLTPNPSDTSLPDQTFGPKALVQTNPPYTGVLISPFCPQFTGLLDTTEANGELSNVGLIATITSSQIINDPLIGTSFLFAVGNRPLVVKTDNDQFVINITLQT
jgi:hypothetical protein